MDDDRFPDRWIPLETSLRAVEDHYRSQRLRPNARPYPEAAAMAEMFVAMRLGCELYIAASPNQRNIMRALLAWSYVLPPYLLRLITLHPKGAIEASEHAIRLALAAASWENNKTDYRDMFMALGAVYADAVSAGINPGPWFQEAASWSSCRDDLGYGIAPMYDFLSRFKESAFFKADIEPRMRTDSAPR